MSLQKILQNIEAKNRTQREKGTSFENIVKLFLFKDKTYSPQFAKVYTYLEWAKANQLDGQDIGIDLVAKNIDDEYCTAIQCKFYGPDAKIDKKSIDSFIAASEQDAF